MHQRLVATTIAIAVLTSTVISIIAYLFVLRAENEEARSYMAELVATVSETAQTASFIGDGELAREVSLILAANRVISCTEISTPTVFVQEGLCYQSDGVVDNDELAVGASGQVPNHPAVGEKYTRSLISPFSNEKTGELTVFSNKEEIQRSVTESVVTIVLALLATIFLVSIAVAVAAYILLSRPLRLLKKKVARIDFSDHGGANKRSKQALAEFAKRRDEIGTIAGALEVLLNAADDRIAKETQLTTKTMQLSRYLRSLFDLSKHAICVCDEELALLSANFEFRMQFEIGEDDTTNSWTNRFFPEDKTQLQTIKESTQLNVPQSFEVEVRSPNDIIVSANWYEITYVKTQGGLDQHEFTDRTQILFYIEDITERKLRHAITEFEASHDSLTGLLNRRAACDRLAHMLKAGTPYESAILLIDLDDFKPVNDELGHEAGDFVLKNIGERLRLATRNADTLARWGGDEFVVGLFNIKADEVLKAAKKLRDNLTQPFHWHDSQQDKLIEIKIGACIGIAIPQQAEDTLTDLIDRADRAMYKIKQSGKDGVAMYGMD